MSRESGCVCPCFTDKRSTLPFNAKIVHRRIRRYRFDNMSKYVAVRVAIQQMVVRKSICDIKTISLQLFCAAPFNCWNLKVIKFTPYNVVSIIQMK